MEGTPYSIRNASSCPESFVSRQAAGLLTHSFCLTAFPKHQVFSGIVASTKSLQQRELSGISTRFPIKPYSTAYRLQI